MNKPETREELLKSQHKSLAHATNVETIKRSQGNVAKSQAVQVAKRLLAEAKKTGSSN